MTIYKIIAYGLLSFCNVLYAVDIGSDTAVTRFNQQIIVGDGDRIAGFTALDGGFNLFNNIDPTLTALFDSFFSVSGEVALNGNTLNLNQDLIFQEVSDFVSLGNINANNHQVHLAPTMKTIPSGDIVDCNLVFVTDTPDLGPNIRAVNWSFDNNFLAVGLQAGGGDDLDIYEFQNNNSLVFVTSETLDNDTVNSVKWHPSKYLLALGRNIVDPLVGSELIIFSFNGVDALSVVDTDTFGADVQGVEWDPTGNFLAVSSEVSTEELRVYPVNSDGTLDKAGVVSIDISPKLPFENAIGWNDNADFVAIGTTGAGGGNELFVFEIGFSPLSITLNASANTGTLRGIDWNPREEYKTILASGGSGNPELRLWEHDPVGGTLTQIFGEAGANVFELEWNPSGNCIAVGTAADASLGEFKDYLFTATEQDLTLIDDFEFGTTIRAVAWTHDGSFVAQGGNNDIVTVYKPPSSEQSFVFSNIRLFLNSNVTLKDCSITFTGNNLLNGRDNCLRFDGECDLRVGEDASLLVQNIRIEGVRDTRLFNVDSTSTFSFKNVTLVMDQDYTFSRGRFDVVQGLNLEGRDCAFVYCSDQKSRILEQGVMVIDTDVTFSYAPSINANTLIEMTNSSSILRLQSGALVASDVGLRLTKGILQIDGRSFLSNAGASTLEGIFWGDGLSSDNNLCIEWDPAANLELLKGFLTNDNI